MNQSPLILINRMALTVAALLIIAGLTTASEPPYAHYVAIAPSDDRETLIAKSASVVPNKPQSLYYQDEFTGFIHFGPNTFTGVEWGNGREDTNVFNPGDTLDTDQWCRVMKAAGMKKIIITAKHHDGFCLWQTRYNDRFSVRSCSWRNGTGDVVRELADSCRRHGLKLGVYLSPADLFQIESEGGLYGNGSEYRESVIPTAPDSFHKEPTSVRSGLPDGSLVIRAQADDYNRYFMNQLYELLTEYGPIHEVWFDGAHPKRKGGQTYRKEAWFSMIRRLAPDAAIFGGPDIRWCGNEGGHTRDAEWSVLAVQDEATSGVDRPGPTPGDEAAITAARYEVYGKRYEANRLQFLICEVDTSIRSGWFWRNDHEQSVRTPDDVFDIYERSVGGNAALLLNVPPNNRGVFSSRDVACLEEVGRRISETFESDLLQGAIVEDEHGEQPLRDKALDTYWQPPTSSGDLVVTLPKKQTINRFVIQEAIMDVGQRIKRLALDAELGGGWEEVATAQTVGYKRILRFPAVFTARLRVRVLDARLRPTIAEVSAHYYRQPPPSVVIHRIEDRVTLATTKPDKKLAWKSHDARPEIYNQHADARIYYTINGDDPTVESHQYRGALDLPYGGRLKARVISNGEAGPTTDVLLGVSTIEWRAVAVSSERGSANDATMAFDGDPSTFWHSKSSPTTEKPHSLAIDLGRNIGIQGITYLPRQDRRTKEGMIESASIEVSPDGQSWTEAAAPRFGNIVNDPTLRTHLFAMPVTARYIRLTARPGADGANSAAVAEFAVLGASAQE